MRLWYLRSGAIGARLVVNYAHVGTRPLARVRAFVRARPRSGRATEALGLLIDARVEDLLFERGEAGSVTALWQLAYRGDARAFEPLERSTPWDRTPRA